LEIIEEGGCDLVDQTYTGPALPIVAPPTDGKRQPTYGITKEFIDQMLEWFKAGKTLPRRYVWEIILGCNAVVSKEQSLTDMELEKGVTCDVIGDTHGTRPADFPSVLYYR
jgi:serine/threonine-protein phosphatase 5